MTELARANGDDDRGLKMDHFNMIIPTVSNILDELQTASM